MNTMNVDKESSPSNDTKQIKSKHRVRNLLIGITCLVIVGSSALAAVLVTRQSFSSESPPIENPSVEPPSPSNKNPSIETQSSVTNPSIELPIPSNKTSSNQSPEITEGGAALHRPQQRQNQSEITDIGGVIVTDVHVEQELDDLTHLVKPRVVGGSSVARGAYPYFVRIDDSGAVATCGGSLVAPDVVLCAAHCLPDKVEDLEVLVNGYHDTLRKTNADQRRRRIVDMQIHPYYVSDTYYNDLMLLKLNETVNPAEIPYVELNRHSDLPLVTDNVTGKPLPIGMCVFNYSCHQ